jgi:Domain of unknown function (DUF6259)
MMSMSLSVEKNRFIRIASPALQACFDGARLISLQNREGRDFFNPRETAPPPLQLQFIGGETIDLGVADTPVVLVRQIGPTTAHVYIEDNEADVCVRIAVNSDGFIEIEPSVSTLRRGAGILRYHLSGIAGGLKLVAPLYQGCRIDLESPLLAPDRYAWPHFWEAPLAILEDGKYGWSVWCHDHLSRPKALSVGHPADARTISLDNEAIGPWDQNTAIGSLTWVIAPHEGDWAVPVHRYRNWLEKTWDFKRIAAGLPDWIGDVRLTFQGCHLEKSFLEGLEKLMPPKNILIETGSWRKDRFDINYPEYVPSEAGQEFLAEASRRGFCVMPYFNFHGCDPTHPFFPKVSRYATADVMTRRVLGWRHDGKECRPFPQGYGRLKDLQDTTGQTELAYIHPGSSVWRHELARRIAVIVDRFDLHGIFIDQTLATGNVDNGLVENLSPTDGMVALGRELRALRPDLAVAGEGVNEMSAQVCAFAQAHLFKSWHGNHPSLGDLEPVPVGKMLWGDICKIMGYLGLRGDTPESRLRMDLHRKLGALPTLTIHSAEQFENLSPAARRLIRHAQEGASDK